MPFGFFISTEYLCFDFIDISSLCLAIEMKCLLNSFPILDELVILFLQIWIHLILPDAFLDTFLIFLIHCYFLEKNHLSSCKYLSGMACFLGLPTVYFSMPNKFVGGPNSYGGGRGKWGWSNKGIKY